MNQANMQPEGFVPFCGLPPVPDEIWQRWIGHPLLLAVLVLIPVLVLRAASQRWAMRHRLCFIAGWSVLCLALVSPLCALSVALFSMRATQHMVLLMVAAPLLALARPELLLGDRMRARMRAMQRGPLSATLCGLAFGGALWVWHAPVLYDATFQSDVAYWAMHVTLLATALLLWMQLLQKNTGHSLQQTALAFGTFVQMGVLGALLTFSPGLLYSAHATSTFPWGITPLADQQLGGLIMWVPGCAVLLLAALLVVARSLTAQPVIAGSGRGAG